MTREEFESILEEAFMEGYKDAYREINKENDDPLTWKYIKPLKDKNSIIKFLLKNKIKLSPSIISFIKKYNGGRPSKKLFDTNKSKECVFKALLSFNSEDSESIYKIYKSNSDIEFIKMNLFPFASSPFGDFICVNLNNNSIVLLRHETMDVEKAAKNIDDFINNLY